MVIKWGLCGDIGTNKMEKWRFIMVKLGYKWDCDGDLMVIQ
jgi:hypothetical protein